MIFFFNKAFLLLSFSLLMQFTYCELKSEETELKLWENVIQLVNKPKFDIASQNQTSSLLNSINSNIPITLVSKIKTNKSKLNLLLALDELTKDLSIQILLNKIEPARLNYDDSLLLIMKIIQMKSFDLSVESNLNLLQKLQKNSLLNKKLDKDKLIKLFHYLKKNILIIDAIKISEKIWKTDRYLFETGELHKLAFKYKQHTKVINHKDQAINCFNKIIKLYPNSTFRAKSAINALSLQINITPPQAIQILFKQAIYPHLKDIPLNYKNDLLTILAKKIEYQETISLLKEWYLKEKTNQSDNQFTNEILLFLVQKAKFDISKLTYLVKNEVIQKVKEPAYFKNMLMEHKIQFLAHWTSPWEPYSDFSQKSSGILKEDKNQLILKCKNTNHSYTKLILKDKNILNKLDYVFFKIKNPTVGNLIRVSIRINHESNDISNIRPDNRWQLIRIPLKELNQPINKITIYLKSPTNSGNNYFFITQPTHLKIKSIENLQKEVK